MIQDPDNNQEIISQEDTASEVEQMFAEEQLKVNSDSTVDFAAQIDNMNHEDVANYYEDQGFSQQEAASHMKGIDFAEQVRLETYDSGTEFAQFSTPDAIAQNKVGDYFAPLDDNTNRSNLGIQNENPETHNREMQIYGANEPLIGLTSTASDMPDWKGSGEVFTGGGTQIFMPGEVSKLSMTYDANSLYPVVQEPSGEVSDTANALSNQNFNPQDIAPSADISPDLSLPSPADIAPSADISSELSLPPEVNCDASATTVDISPNFPEPSTSDFAIAQTPDSSFDGGSNL